MEMQNAPTKSRKPREQKRSVFRAVNQSALGQGSEVVFHVSSVSQGLKAHVMIVSQCLIAHLTLYELSQSDRNVLRDLIES